MHERIRIPHTRVGERARGSALSRAPTDAVLSLQRTVGNRAVTAILARDPKEKAPPKPPADQFRDAVKSKSWPAAAKALNEVPDGDVQALLKPLGAKELDRLDAASAKLKDLPLALQIRTHRHIVFLRRPAAAASAHDDDFKVTAGGKAEAKQKAGGGEVTVRTGVSGKVEPEDADDSGERTDAVSMSYSGAEAGKTRWLQFISREVVIPASDKAKEKWVAGTTGADTGNKYALTTDPDKRVWNTDVASDAATPFYEESGINNRTADATTIFDTPTPVADVVRKQLEGGAKRVISRAHLVTYLVRDMQVLHRVAIDLEWSFTAPRGVSPTPTVTQGPASELDTVHRKTLEKQFPKFGYLP
jgi:hypothetical protein